LANTPQSALEKRLIVVVTNLDRYEIAMERIVEKIQKTISEIILVTPQCFAVSNTRYQKGKLGNKLKMVETSGIPTLIEHMKNLQINAQAQITAARIERISQSQENLIKAIHHAIIDYKNQIEILEKPIISAIDKFSNSMNQLSRNLLTENL